MTRLVLFRPEADAEALEARQWYEERRPGLGEEFAEEVSKTIARIVENPLQFPQVRFQLCETGRFVQVHKWKAALVAEKWGMSRELVLTLYEKPR